MLANLEGTRLKRNRRLSYVIPGLLLGRSKVTGIELIEDYGKTMTITVKDSDVIYFDFAKGRWEYLA